MIWVVDKGNGYRYQTWVTDMRMGMDNWYGRWVWVWEVDIGNVRGETV